ncbi:hypothetical protein FKW77_008188 [Venturia effusa]|uniref:Heme haloperoxidase family profile domain-containing protein n=1 Tax=Venturia effusa TaxID=50376 RepID=A0A517LM00_9PEZI|nr:hypothetical protein FKW77_008188 [Venturia effusa]
MAQPQPPAEHPPIDWNKWSPPGEGDVRSPCPCINALANHHILPHDGKNITKEMAVTALRSAVNLGAATANVFAAGGIGANPDHSANTFDLNHVAKHNFIEHDVSLSRNDIALGSNCDYDKDVWKSVWDVYVNEIPIGGDKVTSWHSASKARYQRLLNSKKSHEEAGKDWHYGIKEVVLSYGESALLLNVLGKDGIAPLEWIRVFVEEERLPYREGWRPSTSEISQTMMHKAMFNLIAANEHKADEAKIAGLGTIQIMKEVVESFVKFPSNCTIM